jgi:hypothetical protein
MLLPFDDAEHQLSVAEQSSRFRSASLILYSSIAAAGGRLPRPAGPGGGLLQLTHITLNTMQQRAAPRGLK